MGTTSTARTPGPVGKNHESDADPCYRPGLSNAHRYGRSPEAFAAREAEYEQRDLEDRFRAQTFYELLTSTADDKTGENDPTTQFLRAIYSPADEATKIGNLADTDWEKVRLKCDIAMQTGTPATIGEAAGELYTISQNIPSSPNVKFRIRSKKDATFALWTYYKLYRGARISRSDKKPECTLELQVNSGPGVGKILVWSQWDWNYGTISQFISSKQTPRWCIRDWIGVFSGYHRVGDDWYIDFTTLQDIEARLASRPIQPSGK